MAKVSRRLLARTIAAKLASDDADGTAIMRELAAYLIANGMIDDADVLMNDIADELFATTGRLVVEVTAARPLSDEARQKLMAYMQDLTSASSVELHETVDESIIGGLIAKTPAAELDVSIQNKLRQLTALAA